MATKLTQSVVDKIRHGQEAGAQVYDADVSGLHIVIGKKSASYKLMGRINDGTPLKDLMTTAEAAKATGHTVETLNQYRSRRRAGVRTPGPSFVKIGRAVFYPRLAIEGYLAGRD